MEVNKLANKKQGEEYKIMSWEDYESFTNRIQQKIEEEFESIKEYVNKELDEQKGGLMMMICLDIQKLVPLEIRRKIIEKEQKEREENDAYSER